MEENQVLAKTNDTSVVKPFYRYQSWRLPCSMMKSTSPEAVSMLVVSPNVISKSWYHRNHDSHCARKTELSSSIFNNVGIGEVTMAESLSIYLASHPSRRGMRFCSCSKLSCLNEIQELICVCPASGHYNRSDRWLPNNDAKSGPATDQILIWKL